jgi:hydrogenase nickel incorporation protein HypA/HybF
MHELSVTQSVLEIALRHAEQANARRITDLHLVVGELSSVVDDAVQFYWELISEGTAAEGSTLHFRRIPMRLGCSRCSHAFHPDGDTYACPACGSAAIRVVTGDEFFLESIDIQNGAQP